MLPCTVVGASECPGKHAQFSVKKIILVRLCHMFISVVETRPQDVRFGALFADLAFDLMDLLLQEMKCGSFTAIATMAIRSSMRGRSRLSGVGLAVLRLTNRKCNRCRSV